MEKTLRATLCMVVAAALTGCASKPFEWTANTPEFDKEYVQYSKPGSGSIHGQAFLQQRNGATVKAAGRVVYLDPATTLATQWFEQYGQYYMPPDDVSPPSKLFNGARRQTIADADGKFKFASLPDGSYYIRTTVTWETVAYRVLYVSTSTQGGIVKAKVEVKNGEVTEAVITEQ